MGNDLDVRYDQLIKQIEKIADLKFKDKVPKDIYDLISELQTNQVELKIQNEEFLNTQKELGYLQDKYLDFYNSLPIGVFILNKEKLIVEANPKVIDLLNTKKEHIINTSFVFFLTDESQIIFSRCARKVFETQITQNCELEYIHADRAHFFANTEIKPLFDVNEKLDQLQIILTNIQEQKSKIENHDLLKEPPKFNEESFNKELKASENRFRVLIQNLKSGVALVDETGKFDVVNPAFMQMFGLDSELDILNVNSQDWSKWEVYGEDGQLLHVDEHPVRKAAINGTSVKNQLVRVQNPEADVLTWMLVSAEPIFDRDNNINMIICTYYDITERKESEILIKGLLNQTREFTYKLEVSNEELMATTDELNAANEELRNQGESLTRLNRALRALSDSDHAMMHAQNEVAYLDEVCRILIEDCGYKMVWIGFAEDNKNKTVRPVAQYGFDEGYIENLNITWADDERGHGPTGTAIRTGKPSVCKNMLTDPNFEPWREAALKRGYASSMVVPLMANNKTLGAISIYSSEPDSFLDEEIKLLAELANDLAFGITNLRLRAEKEKAEKELADSEERYRLILETANSGVLMLDAENRIKYLNQSIMNLLGYSAQEMLDANLIQFVDTKKQKNIRKFMNSWRKGSNKLNEFRFIRKDGSTFWTLLAASPIVDPKGKYRGVICVITDINARKGVEKALMEREKISKSILYDMMGIINKLMKEEAKNDESDDYNNKFEYT